MSRRRNRRTEAKSRHGGNGMTWVKWGGITAAVLVVSGIVVYKKVVSFLHSDEFSLLVAGKVSEVIGIESEFGDFQWDGMHGENPSFRATSDGALQLLEVTDIELDVDTNFVTREVWNLEDVEIATAHAELDLRKDFERINVEKSEKSFIEKWLPERAELLNAEVLKASGVLRSEGGEYTIKGTRVAVSRDDEAYVAKLTGGTVTLPLSLLDQARLKQGELRYFNDILSIEHAELDVFESGEVKLNGKVDLHPETAGYSLAGALTGLRCADLINEDWRQRLRGEVEAGFSVRPRDGNEPEVRGNMVINDGELTALPVLDNIAAFTMVRDFKRLRFSEFRCDFVKYADLIQLKNIYVHCDGLMRIEGRLAIRGDELNGRFQVGLLPGTLSHIPGAEDKVFLPGKEGMSWATVIIGGTADNIEEDLTERLIAAAGDRMFELIGGQQVLKFGGKAIEEFSKNGAAGVVDHGRKTGEDLAGQGLQLLEAGAGAIQGGKDPVEAGVDVIQGGLNSLFGGSKKRVEEDEEDEEAKQKSSSAK